MHLLDMRGVEEGQRGFLLGHGPRDVSQETRKLSEKAHRFARN